MTYASITYSATNPAADSNTYPLFSTVTAFGGKRMFQNHGVKKFCLDLYYTAAGSLKTYRSDDRGANWVQLEERLLLAPISTQTYRRDWLVQPYLDWKLDFVNGGSAQTNFQPQMSMEDGDVIQYQPVDMIYWALAAMGGSLTGSWVDTEDAKEIIWDLAWGSTPSGYFQINGTNDPARATANIVPITPPPLTPPTNIHYNFSAGTVSLAGTPANQITLAGATGSMGIAVLDPMKFMRLDWVRTGSGSSTLNGFVKTRPR